MPRPLPIHQRGPRRARGPVELFLAIPSLDPEWELAALKALMAPPRKAAIVRNRTPKQPWSADMGDKAAAVLREAAGRLGVELDIATPGEGDFHLLIRATPPERETMLALAVVGSTVLPEQTWKLDRLYVRSGKFLRRPRGKEFSLAPAKDVHLKRETRATIFDLL